MSFIKITVILFALMITRSCAQGNKNTTQMTTESTDTKNLDTAVVGGGCYWCTEAQYQLLDGVVSVTSGFSGGTVKNPSYKEVCTGRTGHAEVVQIIYDTTKLNYADILQAFFSAHDPTQLNRQGNDIGTQYRSVIYYANDEQKKIAEQIKSELEKSGAYKDPIVTEISPLKEFYKAENYHQNYFNEHGDEPYCQFVVAPKVEKFKKVFKDKLKTREESKH
jgi:peptide-methionine (S)-S-oxide reductase